ncbi:hypothetical protein SmJEL517_g00103 [Synchytrium microbalum]|uniref:NodB homology domain-containing protein n=1 Tax=Synchytrium microbalum TaxID=1806994 RepID=A0A507CG01_9FUNG|nr:uncharacterized protein SmJEL517_g00103 [Synchytrium microbalum]TPX38109.1 hypothetical protein SmJEL517_g00103 [Synchytrium microbalum]
MNTTIKVSLATISYATVILIGALLLGKSLNHQGPREHSGSAVLIKRQVSPPPIIPQQPIAYPSADETLFIADPYLTDPIVTSSWAYVQSVVPAALLNVTNSTYILFANVSYVADPVANCYWPNDLCIRNTTGVWGLPDIVSCPQDYQWGLTYDDAPSENFVNGTHYNDTVALMDQLEVLNVKTTFFVTGSQSSYYPVSLVAIAKRSHHVAHHTWTHHPLTSLTNEQIVAEMMYTAAIIYNKTGLSVRYFRAPYGDIDDRVRAIVNALGFRIVMWDSKHDATDADVVPSAAGFAVVENIIQSWFNTAPGFIALQHTISTFTSGTSIASLKAIQAVGGIKNQIMPVPQCFSDTQWYKNVNITTVYNACTIPGGCNGAAASASVKGNDAPNASAVVQPPAKSAVASPNSSTTSLTNLVAASSGEVFVFSQSLLPIILSSGAVLASTVLLATSLAPSNQRFGRSVVEKRQVAAPPAVPLQPAAYPSADETLFITGSYLNDPIVTSALAYVNSVVPASLLNIPTSTYIQYSDVTYHSDPVANCYWPNDLCTRTTAGAWGAADIVYCPQNYQWGLTYDDAPSENIVNGVHTNDTVALMNQLDTLNLKATFFITGSQSSYYPASLVAIATRSHHVAHHSWSHHPFTTLTNAQIVAEMMYTAAIIYKNTGLNPRYFRPPYGDIDDRVRAVVNALGYRIVVWDSTYDSTDADLTGSAADFTTVENIISSWFNTAKGFISLQHTIDTFTSGTSIAALKKIQSLGGIKNQMMPVPQCLGDTQWYKNAQVTTIYNSCTIPGGCGAVASPVAASPVASPVQASPVVASPVAASPVASPVQPSPVQASPVKASPSASAVQASPVQASPVKASPSASAVQPSPVQASPVKASPSASAPAASPSAGGLPLTSDGTCGAGIAICGDGTNIDGPCCSQYGWCGTGTAYCGTGCQASFSNNGVCGTSVAASPVASPVKASPSASAVQASPVKASPSASVVQASPVQASPVKASPSASAVQPSPVQASPVKASPSASAPAASPSAGGLPLTSDGTCGAGIAICGDGNNTDGPCCSRYGFSILSSGAVLAGTVLLATSFGPASDRFGRSVVSKRQVSAPPAVPLQPAAYPSADETLFISGTYLNDPIVTSALAYVNSVVPASLLNLAPSTYIQYSDVTYHANTATSCYWPNDLCTRTTAGAWGAADIVYCPQNYQWGLTYDDAPSENVVKNVHSNDTVAIMDQLDAMNIKATFFVTGSQSIYYPTSLIAISSRNHHVAHHSWSHHPFTSLTNAQIVAEMMYTAAIIHKNTGLSVRYFRPPYGDIDDRVRGIVNALGFRIVLWDGKYDSTDADVTANAANFGVVENIISSWFNTLPGFISLQHTISTFTSGTSIAALKKIQSLGGIKNQMMPVPQCLGDTQWYKNAQVTTVWNSCTIPGGCGGAVASPAASPVASPVQASPVKASPSASPVKASPVASPVKASPSASPVKASPVASPVKASPAASAPAASPSAGGLPLTSDGTCGAGIAICGDGTNTDGPCCSQYGWCGTGTAWCGTGCQPSFSNNGVCA